MRQSIGVGAFRGGGCSDPFLTPLGLHVIGLLTVRREVQTIAFVIFRNA